MECSLTIPDDLSSLDATGALELLEQLDAHVSPLWTIRDRLETMANAPVKADEIAAKFLDARDGPQPTSGEVADWPAYRQPSGAHDAYPAGRVIRWTDGHLYAAARTGVAHSPADAPSEWTDVTEELTGAAPPPVPTTPPWSPTATYKYGDPVSYEGKVWKCISAHGPEQQGQWKPGAAWTVWELVG